MPDDRTRALSLILICALMGGSNYISVKIALREIPPFSLIFMRFFFAFLFILPLFLREKPKIQLRGITSVIVFSLLPAINVILFVIALIYTTSTLASMIHMIIPILTVILSSIILKDKITAKKIWGVIIGLAGAAAIIFSPAWGVSAFSKGYLLGNILIFISAFFFALYGVLSKNLQKEHSPLSLNMLFILTTAVLGGVFAFPELTSHPNWYRSISGESIAALLASALFGTVLSYSAYQYAVKYGSPVIASMSIYLQPLFVFLYAAFLFGETVTASVIIGAILVCSGAYIVSQKSYRTQSTE